MVLKFEIISTIQNTPGITISSLAEKFNVTTKQMKWKIGLMNKSHKTIRKVGDELYSVSEYNS